MSQERIQEIQGLLNGLERRIRPLEWDLGRNQINEYKRQQLTKLKEEHSKLNEELGVLQR